MRNETSIMKIVAAGIAAFVFSVSAFQAFAFGNLKIGNLGVSVPTFQQVTSAGATITNAVTSTASAYFYSLSSEYVSTTQLRLGNLIRLPYYSPAASAYTASNGVGAANTSNLTLTIPASTAATTFSDIPRLTTLHGADPFSISLDVRLAESSGGNSATWNRLWICDSSGNTWVFLQVNGSSGSVALYGTSGFLLTGGTIPLDGTGWVRITVKDGRLAVLLGVTSGSTVDWRTFYRGEPSFPTSPGSSNYNLIKFDLYQGSGASATVTSTWSNLQIKNAL